MTWRSNRRVLNVFLAGVLLAVAFLPALAAESGFASPQALLSELYGHYADKPAGSGVDIGDKAVIAKYFAPDTAARIEADRTAAKARGEVPALDGDPFVDAQEWRITNLSIGIGRTPQEDKTDAIVTFRNDGRPRQIQLTLIRTGAGWKIADIEWEHNRLSAILPR